MDDKGRQNLAENKTVFEMNDMPWDMDDEAGALEELNYRLLMEQLLEPKLLKTVLWVKSVCICKKLN